MTIFISSLIYLYSENMVSILLYLFSAKKCIRVGSICEIFSFRGGDWENTPCTPLKCLRKPSVSIYPEGGGRGFFETSATFYRLHSVTSRKMMFFILCAAANSEFLVSNNFRTL